MTAYLRYRYARTQAKLTERYGELEKGCTDESAALLHRELQMLSSAGIGLFDMQPAARRYVQSGMLLLEESLASMRARGDKESYDCVFYRFYTHACKHYRMPQQLQPFPKQEKPLVKTA